MAPGVRPVGTGAGRERRWIRLLVAIIVVLAGAVAVLAILTVVDTGGGENERQTAALDDVVATWNRADGDAFTALFAKDGVLTQYLLSDYYPDPLFTYEGRDEIAAGIDAYAGRGFRTWATGDAVVAGPFSTRPGAWEADGTRGGTGLMVMQLRGDGLIERLWVYSEEAPSAQE